MTRHTRVLTRSHPSPVHGGEGGGLGGGLGGLGGGGGMNGLTFQSHGSRTAG